MRKRIIQFIPAVLAILAIGFTYFSQWCTSEGQVCNRTLLDQMFPYVITPLYVFSLYFLPIAIILIFIPRRTFNSWLKLAKWAIPISILHIAYTPVYSMHFGLDLFPYTRDDAARVTAEAFTAASLVVLSYNLTQLFIQKRYGVQEGKRITSEVSPLFFASVGAIATGLFLWFVSTPFTSFSLSTMPISMILSVTVNPYALWQTVALVNQKRRNNSVFGLRLSLAITLLVASVIGYGVLASILYFAA